MSGPTELIRQNCPIATSNNDGLMSTTQATLIDAQSDGAARLATTEGQADATATANEINVYIDGVNGSDGNSGLTLATAIKTIKAFYDKFPFMNYNGTRFIVNLSGTGTTGQQTYNTGLLHVGYGGDVRYSGVRWRGPAMALATLATGASSGIALDATPAVETTPATNEGSTNLRTRLDFTTAAPGWTVDDMAGRYFLRVSRASVQRYYEIPIIKNDSNAIYVDTLGIVGDILNTDTVEIVVPAVKIVPPSSTGQPYTTNTIRIMGDSWGIEVSDPRIGASFERINFSGTLHTRAAGCRNFDRCSHDGGVWTIQGSHGSMVNCAIRHSGALSQNLHFVTWDGAPNTLLSRPESASVPSLQTSTAPTVYAAMYQSWINIGSRFNPEAAQTGGIELHGQGQFNIGKPLSMRNPPNVAGVYAAIMITGQKAMFLMRASTPTALIIEGLATSGANPTQAGIHCRLGAQAKITADRCSISGVNNLQIDGNVAPIALGTASGAFNEANGYNGNFAMSTPIKRAFTGLVAADSFVLSAAALVSPAVRTVVALRIVTGGNTGPYMVTDSGGTAVASAAGLFGVATISDDGFTIGFPAGSNVTAFTIEYVPREPSVSRIFKTY
jgi:hypothetical protein